MTRKIILGAIILLVFVIVYNLLVQIFDALKSGERLSVAADKVYHLQVKNKELKEKLFQTELPEFIEQQARDKLGLGKNGETVVIIPEDKLKLIMGVSQSVEVRVPNWLGWWKVFFR